jgi:L,D-transpeptidase YcbB
MCLVSASLLFAWGLSHADTATDLAARMDADDTTIMVDGIRLHDADAVRRFYLLRGSRPAWTGPECTAAMKRLVGAIDAARRYHLVRVFLPAWDGPRCAADMERLIAIIESSDSHGLNPADYHLEALSNPERITVDREILATDAWLALGRDLHDGRLDPRSVEPSWTAVRPYIDLVARLERALTDGDVAAALEQLAPPQPFYTALRNALAQYRDFAGNGGWPGVDEGPLLRKGDSDPRVAQLRARLMRGGLLESAPDDPEAPFDDTLEEALKAFQRRANLEPDGIVGPRTLSQLNRSADERIAQLRVNLERWRWLREDLGERHILVNIADFRLEARDDVRIEREHNVIVGRQYRQTPSFSARMSYLVLNPWWEVPPRIAIQEKLPLFQSDPDEVKRLGFELVDHAGQEVETAGLDWTQFGRNHFPFRLRQRPGPQNALGHVKLMFPNAHHVYLHDTPTRGLFARTRRDFSSGCIRVEGVMELTEWVLAETSGWTRARIDTTLASGRETTIVLSKPVSVHLHYLTAVATPAGEVRFIDDVYGRDPAVLAALDAPPPR